MAVTENFFTGNGSTTSYSFTFQYIDEDDIKVTLNGTLTTAYSLANATTVLFNTAPANGVAIRIYRDTNVDNLKATFFAGSAIRAQDLNEDFLQNNYAVQEIKNNTWDNETQTIHSDEAWVSSDSQIATTAAMDARFQDEAAETITSAEGWPDNDDTIATTAAIDNRIDSKIDAAITGDIATDGTGITVTNDGDGTITLGLGANSIDFDRIKDVDIITLAEQDAGSPSPGDTNLFTASAAAKRFDTLVQTTTPSGSTWPVGKTWLQNDADKTLSVWDGDSWEGISSGGTFTSQARVVYVDAANGNDANDGHRISRPKATIKAAITQINADATYGDGSVVVVSPGVYQEVAPIDIQRNNVSIVGQALRSCIVHPTAATETNSLFRVNSGSYIANLTFMGMKASGTRGAAGSIDPNATYGLPPTQGWNVSFFPGATIVKSPYIQNCTNFSDSEINNASLNAFNPAGGSAGDTDSAPTGGGLLVDGSVVAAASPLRSMVCDSYTHVGLDGPAILVTNNGYCQATSSYAFFCHYHIKCLNGGQANLAASTTDFGRYSLIADGKSSAAIFSAALSANVSSGATTFTINTPTAAGTWFGDVTRPQPNMLVQLNGIIYPILSAVANGTGWDVTISRPDPVNRSNNLGLNGAVTTPATAEFFLRSMIASSGHTMEYVGSGTDYTALPENGGVPVEANQRVELNNGAIWTAITDHNGKFTVGDFFEVDQQLGFVTIPTGSIAFDLASDGSPQLGANLDVLNRTISSSTGNVQIDDTLDVTGPILSSSGTAAAPGITFNGDTNTGIYRPGADQVAISTNGTGRLFVDSSGNVGVGASGSYPLDVSRGAGNGISARFRNSGGSAGYVYNSGTDTVYFTGDTSVNNAIGFNSTSNYVALFSGNGTERLRIDSSGRLGVGTSTARAGLTVALGSGSIPAAGASTGAALFSNATDGGVYGLVVGANTSGTGYIQAQRADGTATTYDIALQPNGGRVGVGTTSPSTLLHLSSTNPRIRVQNSGASGQAVIELIEGGQTNPYYILTGDSRCLIFQDHSAERARIDSSGRLLVGTSTSATSQQIESASTGGNNLGIIRYNNGTGGSEFVLAHSRSNSIGTNTVLSSGDRISDVLFRGADGTNYVDAASISAFVDGTPGTNDMPGRLVFSTTADGASSPTERVRIINSGYFKATATGTYYGVSGAYHEMRTSSNDWITALSNTHPSQPYGLLINYSAAPNNTSSEFLYCSDTNLRAVIRSNGGLANYQANNVNLSDINTKKDISPAAGTWDCIKEWEIVNYRYKDQPDDADLNLGVIAQQVAESCPEVITVFEEAKDDQPEKLGIKEQQMYWMAIKALQEAQVRIEQLEAKVAALEGA